MQAMVLTLFGQGEELNALQMALRAGATFVLTLAMLRVSGRRSIGQHRAFDFCVAVLLGSVLSRAVVGASPFWPTATAGAVLVVLHRVVAMASLHWPRFESLVSGDRRDLIRDGLRDPREMGKALITQRDLDEAVRKKCGEESVPVERAVLERDGQITVKIRRKAEVEVERRG
jgi:uncharacterized membrane protein YcaP (DUF421 family)